VFTGEFKGIKIIVKRGDLTEEKADAVVNPANSMGVMTGGVALALKEKGGEVIEKDAIRSAPIRIGRAVLTTGGKLASRRVIHAPTLEKPSDVTTSLVVNKATWAALKLAHDNSFRAIAFPALGTGIGGVGLNDAAKAMEIAVKKYAEECNFKPVVKEVRFIAFTKEMESAWDEVFERLVNAKVESLQE